MLQQGHAPPSRATPPSGTSRTPALQSTVNVLPRTASSHSVQGAAAASLNHCSNEEEDGLIHQFHTHRVQLVSPRKEAEAPPCQGVHSSPTKDSQIDPLWRTTKWLKKCKGEYEDDALIWWPLICPLTDGSDMAALGLAK